MQLIGLSGRDKVGKTSIANRFVQDLLVDGINSIRISYADVLRSEVAAMYNIPVDNFTYSRHTQYTPTIIQRYTKMSGVKLDMVNYKDTVTVRFGDLNLSQSQQHEITRLWTHHAITKLRDTFDDTTVTLRQLLIIHGTHIRRSQDPDYWMKRTHTKINKLSEVYHQVIIDDVRFPNEFELVKDLSGINVWLDNRSEEPINNSIEQGVVERYNCNANEYEAFMVDIPVSEVDHDLFYKTFKDKP